MAIIWFAILLVVGGITIRRGLSSMMGTCLFLSIFQAAAALALGGFFLQPGYVFLLFTVALIAIRASREVEMKWLFFAMRLNILVLLFAAYCLFSALVFPRVFEDRMLVFPLQSSQFPGQELARYYLRPEPTNFNQACYAILSMVTCIASTFVFAREGRIMPIRKGVIASVAVLVVLGLVQWSMRFVGLEFKPALLYNNTGVALLLDQAFGAVPRINVTFIEPSALAVGLGPFVAYLLAVAIIDHRARRLAWLAFGGALILILSTSTTSYLALVVAIISVFLVLATHQRGLFLPSSLFLLIAASAILALLAIAVWLAFPALHDPVTSIFNATVIDKGASSSAIERGSWNRQALSNFFDSYGLGAGYGSARASGLIYMLLGTTGIPGLALYLMIVGRSLLPGRHDDTIWSPDLAGLKAGTLTATITLFVSSAELTSISFWIMVGALAVNRVPIARDDRHHAERRELTGWHPAEI